MAEYFVNVNDLIGGYCVTHFEGPLSEKARDDFWEIDVSTLETAQLVCDLLNGHNELNKAVGAFLDALIESEGMEGWGLVKWPEYTALLELLA